jgi:hypothetical protein
MPQADEQIPSQDRVLMSERQRYIHLAHKSRPEDVAGALTRIANILDHADERKEITFYAGRTDAFELPELVKTWAHAALLIADIGNVPTTTLRATAAAIWKGEQDALFT